MYRANPQVLDRHFLLYSMLGPYVQQQIRSMGSGSTVEHMRVPDCSKWRIRVPDLTTQRRIASILSAYDDLIENNTRRIQILEEMAQAIYREWFVEFRFPGHEGVRMVDSELGRVPEGWSVTPMQTQLTLEYGKALKADDRVKGSVPVIGSSGIVGFHNQAMVPGPGIVVGRKGNVGSIIWIDSDFFPIDTTFYVQTGHEFQFVYYQLLRVAWVASDTAVPGLSRRQAYAEPFLAPPLHLEKRFVDVVAPMRRLIHNLHSSSSLMRQARDLLLPRLISGEIDVSDLNIGNAEPAA